MMTISKVRVTMSKSWAAMATILCLSKKLPTIIGIKPSGKILITTRRQSTVAQVTSSLKTKTPMLQ